MDKKEYIERGALLKKIRRVTEYDEGGWGVVRSAVLVEDIETAPAVDVAPVAHGTWMVLAAENHTDAVCSICKKSFYYHNKGQYHIDHSNYCPNRGAKMDGGSE